MPYRGILRATGSYAARYAAAKARGAAYRGYARMAGRIMRGMRNRGLGVGGYGARRTKRGRTRFVRKVRSALLKTTETGYKSLTVAQGTGAAINHDTLKNFTLWDEAYTPLFPTQGLGDGNRIGDEIYVTGLKLRMQFEMPYDRRNTKIKLWYVPYDSASGDPALQAHFQHNVTGNTFLDPIQNKRWPGVKYLGMYQLTSTDQPHIIGETPEDKTLFINKWIPIYKKVAFKEDGSSVVVSGLPERGSIIATAYDTYSTFQTDTVVSRGEIACTLYYKDP